jgi:amino acid adenylation domain-containing protein
MTLLKKFIEINIDTKFVANIRRFSMNNKKSFLEGPCVNIRDNAFKTVSQMFEEHVNKNPGKTALVFNDKRLTYEELNNKSNKLASMICEAGVKHNDIVGIMVNRSLEMLICILAVLKAGGTYLPIDPEYPDERIKFMLEDCGVRLVLTKSNMEKNRVITGEKIYCDDEKLYDGHFPNPNNINSPNDLIYIIYTSGSTGKPKGVMIEYLSIFNLIEGMKAKIGFNSHKTILSLASMAFDMSKPEILLPLTQGMTIVIADEQQQKNPKLLNACIVDNGVDMLQITPSRLQLCFNYGKSMDFLKVVKDILIGAEGFPKVLFEKLSKATDARIYNLYGPTETTVWSAIADLTDSKEIHAGLPIINTQLFIVDENMKLCDVGVEGELCISGDGVARGYLNRIELTEEKFVHNPFMNGSKMYRTGDLARITKEGNLEIIGRIDSQVKLNGRRIELGEIEYHIQKFDSIKEAAVALKNNMLCAYYMSDTKIVKEELKSHLQKVLPDYMIPSYYTKIDKIPTSFNGKVDKKALPDVDKGIADNEDDNVYPETTEYGLKKLLVDKLGVKMPLNEISSEEELNSYGVDSVAFVKFIVHIESEFGVEFGEDYLELSKLPTLKKITEYVDSLKELESTLV